MDGRDSLDGRVPVGGHLWVATLPKQYQQWINWMMKELGWQYEREHTCVCVQLYVCVYLYPYGRWVGEETAEGRADYVWKSLHTLVSITSVWSVRESKQKASHIGPCCFSTLWLSAALASVAPPSQLAHCNRPCLTTGSGYSSAHPTWTLRGTQYSLHRPRPIDCFVRGHIIPTPHWTGRGFIQSVSGYVYSQQMTFNYG